ncbi:uncharacterized protein LOC144665671 isoform X2 [Oculina patagonica]
MFGSAFNRLFFIACLWQNVAFLQCRSTIEVAASKHSELSGQQITRCLRSCVLRFQNDVFKGAISSVKLSWQQFCQHKCVKKREKLSIPGGNRKPLDDQQIKIPSFKKIKRDISNSQQNSTSSWDPDGCIKETSNSAPTSRHEAYGLRVTFHKLKNTGRYYANVSWKPVHNNSVSWTGYRIVYLIDLLPPYQCKDLKKDDTNYIINNSSYGLRNQSRFIVGVTFLPSTEGRIIPLDCTVPMDCPDNTITDGVTNSPTSGGETKSLTTDSSMIDEETKPSTTDSSLIDSKINNAKVAVIVSACVLFVLVISAAIVFLYFRRSHQRSFSQSDMEFEYDAFVIFSSEDSDWVIKTLIPTLEEKHGLKCCVHYRDFTLGVPIRQNMVDSVYKCKKTVAVVSTHFFNSKYCGSELDYALHRLMEKKDDSLVVIKLDNVDRSRLPKELQKRSYIDYPKSTEKETWEKKLIKCLQASRYPSQSYIL